MGLTALLCGASGLVGGACLELLETDPAYDRVVLVTRRDLGFAATHPKVVQKIVDFSSLDRHRADLTADHVFCALGTTIRKAGSQERFREVDFAYPYQIAKLTLANGARHYALVSALGADPRSRLFYYRVKGEVEEAIRGLGFPSLAIFRPSLLLGKRPEFRLGEILGKLFIGLVPGKYRGIEATVVAKAMVEQAKQAPEGCLVLESPEIRAFAERAE